jgi:dihydrolipoamide dehydrogenase
VIATGTCPAGLPGAPLDGGTVISHRELFAPVELPGRIAVVGADVEGAELAMLLSALGFRVTVVERLPELLPGLDRDLASPVERRLLEAGVGLELGSPVTGVSRGRKGVALALGDGRSVEAGAVLITGIRRPDLPAGLERAGLERAGLDRDGPGHAGPEHAGLGDSPAEGGGGIPVQPSLATAVPGIYAAGDVNGLLGMAHAAIQQGTLLARSLRTGVPISADHRSSYAHPPRAIYTIPEIGGAGRTERELQAAGAAYRSARVELRDTWRGLCRDPGEGFLKLLADPSGTVLGVWMCAAGAAEASALFGLILERGLQAQELAGALVTHPTVAEALREAALAVGAR